VTAWLFDLVVPTLGRPSLATLLEALVAPPGPPRDLDIEAGPAWDADIERGPARDAAVGPAQGPLPGRVLVVDDRRGGWPPLEVIAPEPLAVRIRVVRGRGAGPAAARNLGWRLAVAPWVAFLDDDVVPDPGWLEALQADLASLDPTVAGSQGRLRVPLPGDRRPTDRERNVAALAGARWVTADMAYRRAVLTEVGGFDERFPRAYREDSDLALRVLRAGYRIGRGRRKAAHPVRRADPLVSVRLQAGNADDVLMRALHGPGWRQRAGESDGRRGRHLATTLAGLAGLASLALGRRRLAATAGAAWLAGTAEFAWARVGPGPRDPRELATMALTSALIPAAATWHRLRGLAGLPRLLRSPGPAGPGSPAGPRDSEPARPAAVLLDRDGTLVDDIPDNGDPERVVPRPGARRALERLRAAEVPLAVVSNQSGVASGALRAEQMASVNRRVEELLGPVGPWLVCTHGTADGCRCRKPAPGLVEAAAVALGVDPGRCVVIGDVGSDVEAATAAGAQPVLVPTAATLGEEVAAAPAVAADLEAAVDLLLGPAGGGVATTLASTRESPP
jgi:histidinol-phosphate phosphatase family protein